MVASHFFAQDVTPGVPTVMWGTYLGGTAYDESRSVYCDPSGNLYVASTVSSGSASGVTQSMNSFKGGNFDICVTKLASNGEVIWSRFIGGPGDDFAYAISAGPEGTIIIGGNTTSVSGISNDGIQSFFGGGTYDGVVASIFPDGEPNWSTYLGGTGDETVFSIGCGMNGRIIVGGQTSSNSLNMNSDGQTVYGGGSSDGFLYVYNSSGALSWNTYIGGPQADKVTDVCGAMNSNTVYVCGVLLGQSIPLFQETSYLGGACDGYLAAFGTGGQLQWSKLLGGSGNDEALALSLDPVGNLMVAGTTTSTDVAMLDAHQPAYGGGSMDGFIMRYSPVGIPLWSTLYGGNGIDQPTDIHVNFLGDVYISMNTTSTAMASGNAFNTVLKGGMDALITKWSTQGNILWASYVGGSEDDQCYRITTNNQSKVIAVGRSFSGSIYDGDVLGAYSGSSDGFAMEISDCDNPIVTIHTADDTIFCDGQRALFCGGGAPHLQWVTGDTTLTVEIDTTMIVYAIGTNNNGCSSRSNEVQVIANPRPEIFAWADGPTSFCDSGAVWLFAEGVAELEWNNGVAGDSVLANEGRIYVASGIGENGCPGSSNAVEIEFIESPEVQMAAASNSVCISDDPVALIALPLGGTFYGNGVWSNTFNPADAGGGDHEIYYSYTNEEGCNTTAGPININVKYHETALVTAEDSLCVSDGSILLTGQPAGGTFNGNGVMNDLFFPQLAGVGAQTVTYSYVDMNGCINVATQEIYVDACAGMEELTAATLELYPNPADNMIMIHPSWTETYTYRLYNAAGQLVLTGNAVNQATLETSHLAEGLYFLTAVYKTEHLHAKVQVKR